MGELMATKPIGSLCLGAHCPWCEEGVPHSRATPATEMANVMAALPIYTVVEHEALVDALKAYVDSDDPETRADPHTIAALSLLRALTGAEETPR